MSESKTLCYTSGMIFTQEPPDFNSKFNIVSCFVKKGDKLLLLHRQDHKPQGNTWGIPAGKVDVAEDLSDAVQRELREETSIKVDKKEIHFIEKVYNQYPEYDFIFHMFHTEVPEKTIVRINPKEHKSHIWIKSKEVKRLNLMEDIGECIKLYYSD